MNPHEQLQRWLRFVAITLLTWFFSFLVIAIIINETLPDWENGLTVSVYAGSFIWLCISCRKGGILWRQIRFVKENQALIVGNWLRKELRPALGTRDPQPLNAQRALRSGINLTDPWEYTEVDGLISTAKVSVFDTGEEESYRTSDNLDVHIKRELSWAPIYGKEVEHYRFIKSSAQGSDASSNYHNGNLRSFLQLYISARKINDVTTDIESLRLAIANVLLASPILRAFESSIGSEITNIQVSHVVPTAASQEILSSKRKLEIATENAKELVAESGGTMDLDRALLHNAIASKLPGAKLEVKQETITDNIKVSGLPDGLSQFSILRGAQKATGNP
jgi:hypothetical protein